VRNKIFKTKKLKPKPAFNNQLLSKYKAKEIKKKLERPRNSNFDNISQSMTTSKFRDYIGKTTQYDSKYKYVNLESSDGSSLSLSRISSKSRDHSYNSRFSIPNYKELNRGKEAKQFRESLKRSSSRHKGSIERRHPPLLTDSKKLTRVTSD
jgi:hypothetical protein